jgi:L-seryl-tRNA(Ser) seleniumtransferase
LVARVNRNPMKRALRVDKMRLAAIEATLKLYRDPDRLHERLPTLRLLSRTRDEIAVQARHLLQPVAAALGKAFTVEICDCESQIGSGALPLSNIPSAGFAIRSVSRAVTLEWLAERLRNLSKPVIGRIEDDALRLDLRCLECEAGFLAALTGLACAFKGELR